MRKPSSRRARASLWALLLLWGLPALAVAVGYIVLPKDNPPGRCEGIGFGCTPSPADGLLIVAMYAAPVLVLFGVVALAVIALLPAGRRRR